MNDKIVNEVETQFTSTGADSVISALSKYERAVSDAGTSGALTGKQVNTLSSYILKSETILGRASSGVNEYSRSFSVLRDEVSKANEAIRQAAEEAAGAGSRTPLADVSPLVTDKDIADARAVAEAESAGVLAVGRLRDKEHQDRVQQLRDEEAEIASARERELAGLRQVIQLRSRESAERLQQSQEADKLNESARAAELKALRANIEARSSLEDKAHQEAVSNAQQEQKIKEDARAQELAELRQIIQVRSRQQADVTARGQETDQLNESARAAELAALKQQILARNTQQAVVATKEHAASLPTLRYALYDISSSLAITGAAMTAFSVLSLKSAIDYERSFADVIRTNDNLRNSSVASERAFQRFVNLAGELPTTFADLSEIGTLAGQLGVATGRMEAFTKATAMFSAVTGESIDTTATAFGRLDALLPDVKGNYDALGSSILNVGINSVATEGEVIKITTQLAGVGRQAGLTADQVIGLSGALASVGVQPELARGTITRLFGQISRAVATGGETLNGFAAIAGTTADKFTSKWGSSPMQAVLDIFEGIRDRGAGAESALRSVGITSVRDVPAILRLSQTMDSVLVPALKDAEDGFKDGSQLSENYGIIAETTAAKLQILSNNFQSLLAAIGDSSGLLSLLIDTANEFLVWVRELQQNPITAFFSQAAVIITGVIGVMTLLAAAAVRASAGMIAFKTAMIESGVAANGLRGSLMALTGSLSGVNAQSAAANGTMGRLTGVMRGMNIATAALVAIPVAQWISDWAKEAQGAVVDAETLNKAIFAIDPNAPEELSTDIQAALDKALASLGASTQSVTWVQNLTSGFGAGVGQWIGDALFGPDAEAQLDMGLARLGSKVGEWWQANPLADGAPSFWASMFDGSYDEIAKFEEAFILAWESAGSETQKQAVLDAYAQLEESVISAGGSAEGMAYNFQDFHNVVGDGVNQTLLSAEALDLQEQNLESLRDEMTSLVDEVFFLVNAQADLQDSLFNLGEAFIADGAAAAFSGEAMQASIRSIIEQSGGAGTAAANLQVLFDYLVQGGFASASQLTHLAQVIAGLKAQAGGKVSLPTLSMPDFSGFQQGMQSGMRSVQRASDSAGRSAREAAQEVRTLVDYANDLAKVWDRAFDIRFSGQTTLDAITSSLISIREAADEAAKRIRDLNNDIASLSSDIKIQEYFLSIAVEYGDTKRAAAIEAELAKKRAELADKTDELQSEQDKANKSLEGNSKGAIENRKTITDLVRQYQAHIGALAASGMSQADLAIATQRLKADFIAQATQLGYNRAELERYAKGFDDVATAIARVPRNITVTASVDPAVQAFNELEAATNRANNAYNGLRGNLAAPVQTGGINPAGANRMANLASLQAEIARLTSELGALSGFNQLAHLNRIYQIRDQIRNGQYYTGGFTGRGGMYEPAGTVHRGEYVFPKSAVDQSTGLPTQAALLGMLGSLPSRSVAAPSRATSSSSATTVALTAGSIQAIAQAVQPYLVIDGKLVGDATSRAYANDTTVGAY